jgi:hypothetical protein
MGGQSRSPIAIQRQVTITEFAAPGDRPISIFVISRNLRPLLRKNK